MAEEEISEQQTTILRGGTSDYINFKRGMNGKYAYEFQIAGKIDPVKISLLKQAKDVLDAIVLNHQVEDKIAEFKREELENE